MAQTNPLVQLRLAIFVLCAAGLIGPPFYRQVLGGTDERFRNWEMFTSTGSGAIAGEFERVSPDGAHHPIDGAERLELLGHAPTKPSRRTPPPTWTWRIRSDAQLEQLVSRTCRSIHKRYGPRQYLVMTARRATARGWETVEWGQRNACLERPGRTKPKPKPRSQR